MAFDYEQLTRVGGTAKATSMFTYVTEDSFTQVTESDYFKGSVINSGDYVHVKYNDGYLLASVINNTALVIDRFGLARTFGFIDYNDSSTSVTPVTLTADTWTDIPNDGLGAFTNKQFAPAGVTEVLDTSAGYLDFSQLNLGSEIKVRNDFTVTPQTNNCLLEARYLLGSGAGEYALQFWSERLDSGSGIPYQRVTNFPIYMGDTNTQDNPGKMQIRLSTSGIVVNAGVYVSIGATQ